MTCTSMYMYIKRVNDTYPIITRSAVTGQLVVPSYNTTRYGLNSIYKKCIDSWNMITSEINKSKKMDSKTDLFKMYSRNELKTTLTKHLFCLHGFIINNCVWLENNNIYWLLHLMLTN